MKKGVVLNDIMITAKFLPFCYIFIFITLSILLIYLLFKFDDLVITPIENIKMRILLCTLCIIGITVCIFRAVVTIVNSLK